MIDITPQTLDVRIREGLLSGDIRLGDHRGESGGMSLVKELCGDTPGRLALKLTYLGEIPFRRAARPEGIPVSVEAKLRGNKIVCHIPRVGKQVLSLRDAGTRASLAAGFREELAYRAQANQGIQDHFLASQGSALFYFDDGHPGVYFATSLDYSCKGPQMEGSHWAGYTVKTATMLYPVCAALEALHERGMVHGDIKPGNILGSGLIDFGLATPREQDLTGNLQRLFKRIRKEGKADRPGTVAYASPEMVLTHERTPYSDLYSLGLTILQLFDGNFWMASMGCFSSDEIMNEITSRTQEVQNRATTVLKEMGVHDGLVAGVHDLLHPPQGKRTLVTTRDWAQEHRVVYQPSTIEREALFALNYMQGPPPKI